MASLRNLFCPFVLALVAAPLIAHADPMYSITPIGQLGDGMYASGINDFGQITGTRSGYGFFYTSGNVFQIGPDGGDTAAMAINDAGQVVGRMSADPSQVGHAFIYWWASDNFEQDLGTLGGQNSEAFGINRSGEIVGIADTSASGAHAFYYGIGGMQDLGTLGGRNSGATGINDHDQITGWSALAGDNAQHAFLYQNGTMTDLGTLGGTESGAFAINNAGAIVGTSTLDAAGNIRHAFLYANGVMTDLGTLGGATDTFANAINDAGQVVGNLVVGGRTTYLGFLYQDGRMMDLNTLVDPASGWTIVDANGINNKGQIVGIGFKDNQFQSIVLSPVPEPASCAMLLAGVGLLGALRRRRNL